MQNQATNILLKMSGKTVEKEFEVKDTPKTDTKNKGLKMSVISTIKSNYVKYLAKCG